MARHTRAEIRNGGNSLTVQRHETDSPIIPIDQIERLHQIKPDRIDWIFDQTQLEAEFRRETTTRNNRYIFIERLIGQICALLMGMSGIIGGVVTSIYGYPIAGTSISTTSIATLAIAFLYKKKEKADNAKRQ